MDQPPSGHSRQRRRKKLNSTPPEPVRTRLVVLPTRFEDAEERAFTRRGSWQEARRRRHRMWRHFLAVLTHLVELATRVGIPAPTAEDLSVFFKASNPHLEFFNSSTHGYNVLEVTSEQLTCTMWAVNTVRFPEATLYPLRRFRVPVNEALIVQSPI